MHAVLERVASRVCRELEDLDVDTAQSHPGGRDHIWNMQQVVEHLVLTYRLTSQNLEGRLEKGRVTRNQRRSLVEWLLQLMVLTFGYIPRGVPAIEDTLPGTSGLRAMNGEDLIDLLRHEMGAMDAVLDRCRHKFGMERVATHPLLGSMRVDQWRRFHAVHGLHHMKQLRRIREQVLPQVQLARGINVGLAKELHIPAQRSLT